jgi:hypothetical protein
VNQLFQEDLENIAEKSEKLLYSTLKNLFKESTSRSESIQTYQACAPIIAATLSINLLPPHEVSPTKLLLDWL